MLIYSGMNEDQIEDYFKKKYSSQPSYAGATEDDAAIDDISRHSLLPSTKDPNLWIVKCRMGEEKLVALQLMRKAIAYEHTENVLSLLLLFCNFLIVFHSLQQCRFVERLRNRIECFMFQ